MASASGNNKNQQQHQVATTTTVAKKVGVKDAAFDLPEDISEEDELLLTGVLSAMYASEVCSSYKIHTIPVGFLIRGTLLNEETFEIDLDDLQFITCVNPVRIERIAVCNSGGKIELVIKVLNSKQRVVIATSCTFTASKKRKYAQIG